VKIFSTDTMALLIEILHLSWSLEESRKTCLSSMPFLSLVYLKSFDMYKEEAGK
jgi:hypothetical protein